MSTYASDFLVIVVQMYFAGKMGATSLAAVSLGASFCNVFGFSLGVGMLSAFDILSAQAYGANELRRVGVALHQTLVAMLLLALVVLPLWWVCMPGRDWKTHKTHWGEVLGAITFIVRTGFGSICTVGIVYSSNLDCVTARVDLFDVAPLHAEPGHCTSFYHRWDNEHSDQHSGYLVAC